MQYRENTADLTKNELGILKLLMERAGSIVSRNEMICQLWEMEEYKSYVEGWTHEIKTPIAVSKLILENNRSNWSLSVKEDYRIQEVSLKEVSTDLMKKYAKLLIGKGITPSLKNLDYYVLSDVKWTEFMAGQAVSNAIKYLAGDRTPLIVLEAEDLGEMVSFSIRDNGIGIPAGDLKRVFKKGFTGENGRRYKKSTGMGLYLCKQLCDKMGVQIKVESIQGAGHRRRGSRKNPAKGK